MIEDPSSILKKSWGKQASYLRKLTRKELEVLWRLVQEHEESFDRLRLAVFSILRETRMRRKRSSAPSRYSRNRSRHEGRWISGRVGGVLFVPKIISNPGSTPVKSLDEIRQIAQGWDAKALDTLSSMELSVLLAMLNRFRVGAQDEEAFAAFYLDVANRIRNRGA